MIRESRIPGQHRAVGRQKPDAAIRGSLLRLDLVVSMNQKEPGDNQDLVERPPAPVIGATHSEMVFTLPNQQAMPTNGLTQNADAEQDRPIQPALSLQFFEPESFLEVQRSSYFFASFFDVQFGEIQKLTQKRSN